MNSEKNSLTYIGYRVTEKCNAKCPFCFSYVKEIPPDPSLDQIKKALLKLKDIGITSISIMGGEPLLRKDIVELMEMTKYLGFEVILSTNAFFLKPLMNKINGIVDWISISLDADNMKNNDRYRSKGQFKKATEIIRMYNPKIHKFKLKINTVVHKENIDEVDGIGELIGNKPIRWKLLHFTPRELGKTNKKRFFITIRKFKNKCNKLKEKYPHIKIVVRTYRINEDYDLLLVRPNGDLLVNRKEDYWNIGNIFDDDIERKIERINNLRKNYYRENWDEFEESYR